MYSPSNQTPMDNNNLHGYDASIGNSMALSGIAIVLWTFSHLTLNHLASIATIIAALCSAGYTLYKWYKEAKK